MSATISREDQMDLRVIIREMEGGHITQERLEGMYWWFDQTRINTLVEKGILRWKGRNVYALGCAVVGHDTNVANNAYLIVPNIKKRRL